MATTTPSKQAARELARWKRILSYHAAGLSKAEMARLESVGEEQIRRLLHAAKDAETQGWI